MDYQMDVLDTWYSLKWLESILPWDSYQDDGGAQKLTRSLVIYNEVVNNGKLISFEAKFDESYTYFVNNEYGIYSTDSWNRRLSGEVLTVAKNNGQVPLTHVIERVADKKDASTTYEVKLPVEHNIRPENIIVHNPYAVFVNALLTKAPHRMDIGAGGIVRTGQLMKDIMRDLPWCPLADVGAYSAAREDYMSRAFKQTHWSETAPVTDEAPDSQFVYTPLSFKPQYMHDGSVKVVMGATEKNRKKFLQPHPHHMADWWLLVGFGLVRMAKSDGSIIDARNVAFCLSALEDEADRILCAKIICLRAAVNSGVEISGDAAGMTALTEWVRKTLMFEKSCTPESIWKRTAEELIVALSSKAAKAVKRCVKDLIVAAFMQYSGCGLDKDGIWSEAVEGGQPETGGRYGFSEVDKTIAYGEAAILCGTPASPGYGAIFQGNSSFKLGIAKHSGVAHEMPMKALTYKTVGLNWIVEEAGEMPEVLLSEQLKTSFKKSKVKNPLGEIPAIDFSLITNQLGGVQPTIDCAEMGMDYQVEWPEGQRGFFRSGEVICYAYYKDEDLNICKYAITATEAESYVSKISWSLKLMGRESLLTVKVTEVSLANQLKLRGEMKCLASLYRDSLLFNGMNDPNISAKMVFFADANKWLDCVYSLYPTIQATIYKNVVELGCNNQVIVELYERIREVNKMVGGERYKEEEFASPGWHPLAALLGLYQPIIEDFLAFFGKAIWVKWEEPCMPTDPDLARGVIYTMLQMYEGREGWSQLALDNEYVVNKILPSLPTGWKNLKILVNGEVVNDKTDVLVFAEIPSEGGKIQYGLLNRAWGYVGTKEIPLFHSFKVEAGTAKEISQSLTRMMIDQALVIAGTYREYAKHLVKDGYSQIHKLGAFVAMSRGKSFMSGGQ
jgi:hypothetical protein